MGGVTLSHNKSFHSHNYHNSLLSGSSCQVSSRIATDWISRRKCDLSAIQPLTGSVGMEIWKSGSKIFLKISFWYRNLLLPNLQSCSLSMYWYVVHGMQWWYGRYALSLHTGMPWCGVCAGHTRPVGWACLCGVQDCMNGAEHTWCHTWAQHSNTSHNPKQHKTNQDITKKHISNQHSEVQYHTVHYNQAQQSTRPDITSQHHTWKHTAHQYTGNPEAQHVTPQRQVRSTT